MCFAELIKDRRKVELLFMATAMRVGSNATKDQYKQFIEGLEDDG